MQSAASVADDLIEIEVVGTYRVRVGANFDGSRFCGALLDVLVTAMIPMPSDVRVWLAVGRTDMRRGMNGLALQVQEALQRDPHAGDLFVFRGARGDLIKILWHDGLGLSLYAKRLERGRFVWPPERGSVIAGSRARRKNVHSRFRRRNSPICLSGIDWRNPVQTFRPQRAG